MSASASFAKDEPCHPDHRFEWTRAEFASWWGRLVATSFGYAVRLRRVHECVFGVLALESEPVDPRL